MGKYAFAGRGTNDTIPIAVTSLPRWVKNSVVRQNSEASSTRVGLKRENRFGPL